MDKTRCGGVYLFEKYTRRRPMMSLNNVMKIIKVLDKILEWFVNKYNLSH